MELLRRALLIGCLLPALWLFRLAPLDALVSIAPVNFADRQATERAALSATSTEEQRRRAALPVSVYIEETLQYNVYSAAGPEWDAFLSQITARAQPAAAPVFLRADTEPMSAVVGRLAAGDGRSYISISRPGGDQHYEVNRHLWTRRDFSLRSGFEGASVAPVPLLYPFRVVALAATAVGLLCFFLLPSRLPDSSTTRVSPAELAWLAVGLTFFTLPLAVIGGSVQALTRAPLITAACWSVGYLALHRFAGPMRHAPDPLIDAPGDRAIFVREGFVFLLIALGPTAFLVSSSLILWNR